MKAICIALHDVSPATWGACRRILDQLDRFGRLPLTFLVVPDHHRTGRVDASPRFVDELSARAATTGSEIALHGLIHLDEGPPPRTPLDAFRRRVLTQREGEFAALPAAAAEWRIRRGLECLARVGWHPSGFVPPAWLLSTGTREALRCCGLRYTATHRGVELIAAERFVAAPAISASGRAPWRVAASAAWLAGAPRLLGRNPLWRVAIHPVDADHPALMRAWCALIAEGLTERVPLTKGRIESACSPEQLRGMLRR